MAQFVNDTFTDTNGTVLTAHTGETGATWTDIGGSGVVKIDSNQIYTDTVGSNNYTASGTPIGPDYSGTVHIDFKSLIASQNCGIAIRLLDTQNYYRLQWTQALGLFRLSKRVANVATTLADYGVTVAAGDTAIVSLSAVGTTITATINGVAQTPVTDSSLSAAGKFAMFLAPGASTAASATTGLHFDRVYADDIVSGSSAALTGLAATGSKGTPGPANSEALTGPSATTALGTASPTNTVALSGLAATGSLGALAASGAASAALTGVAATSSPGTASPGTAPGLTGAAAAAAPGTPTALATYTAALTGASSTGATGALNTARSAAVTGPSATASPGTAAPVAALSLPGVSATASSGTLTVPGGAALVGLAGASSAGSVGPTTVRALTGVACTGAGGAVGADRTLALVGAAGAALAGTTAPAPSLARPILTLVATTAAGDLASASSAALPGATSSGDIGQVTAVSLVLPTPPHRTVAVAREIRSVAVAAEPRRAAA